jgi:hypothetical protein
MMQHQLRRRRGSERLTTTTTTPTIVRRGTASRTLLTTLSTTRLTHNHEHPITIETSRVSSTSGVVTVTMAGLRKESVVQAMGMNIVKPAMRATQGRAE